VELQAAGTRLPQVAALSVANETGGQAGNTSRKRRSQTGIHRPG
jgi:hypothetical protein